MIGIQPDKYLLFGLAKLQGEIIPLQTHNVEEVGLGGQHNN